MNKLLWEKRIINWAGALGAILPWLALLGAGIVSFHEPLSCGFWDNFSISATYYISPALTGILTTASVVLMCYDGYDRWDSIVTTISGLFGLLIVLFPCDCAIAPEYVGFFQLPVKVSNVLHCTSATVFFCLLAYNDLFLFTKHSGEEVTGKKKVRNAVYIVCGIGMLSAMVLMPLPVSFPAKTWWVEMLALSFFGFSWLTKGGAIPLLNDKE